MPLPIIPLIMGAAAILGGVAQVDQGGKDVKDAVKSSKDEKDKK